MCILEKLENTMKHEIFKRKNAIHFKLKLTE